jgi:hypothetical protein
MKNIYDSNGKYWVEWLLKMEVESIEYNWKIIQYGYKL